MITDETSDCGDLVINWESAPQPPKEPKPTHYRAQVASAAVPCATCLEQIRSGSECVTLAQCDRVKDPPLPPLAFEQLAHYHVACVPEGVSVYVPRRSER
jgi:hypothetical protein